MKVAVEAVKCAASAGSRQVPPTWTPYPMGRPTQSTPNHGANKTQCDEQTPECSQCLRSGKACPGPLQGTLFIDVVSETHENSKTVRGTYKSWFDSLSCTSTYPCVDNKPSKKKRPVTASSTSQSLSVASQRSEPSQQNDVEDIEPTKSVQKIQAFFDDSSGALHDVQLPSIYQPFQVPSYQEMFTHEFIFAFFNPKLHNPRLRVWVNELPSLLLSVSQSSALMYAVRAATIAHYGKRSGDVAVQTEACRWYDKGLKKQVHESQQTQLRLTNGENLDDKLGVAAICAPIMFSLFESLMTTSFAAWASHLTGAIKLLEMRGPDACRSGVIHQLFRTARLGAVSLPHYFASFNPRLTA